MADDETTIRFSDVEDAVARGVATALDSGKYSSGAPEEYAYVRKTFADQYDLPASDLTWRINELAAQWKDEHGRWPKGTELYQWDTAQNSIWTYATGFSRLGSIITIDDPEAGAQYHYYNDPVRGLVNWSQDDLLRIRNRGIDPEGKAVSTYAAADLPAILAGVSPRSTGSGGRGSAARTAQTFDRRELARAAMERWRGELMEEPDDKELERLVSGYIKDANAFWVGKAGRLDFDTYIMDNLERTPRWSTLYSKKPPAMTPAEYRAQYQQSVGQFGLSSRTAQKQVESGLTSGAGVAGFTERVSRTREARTINAGTYSQRFAQSMAQSGLGGT